MTRLLLAVLLVASPRVAVQELLNLEGTWRGSCADCAPNAMPAQTLTRHVYRVSGNTLTVERSARGIHPNEPPSERWVRIGTSCISATESHVLCDPVIG